MAIITEKFRQGTLHSITVRQHVHLNVESTEGDELKVIVKNDKALLWGLVKATDAHEMRELTVEELRSLTGRTVVNIIIEADSMLRVHLSGNVAVVVLPDPEVEAWELWDVTCGGSIVCHPGGTMGIW